MVQIIENLVANSVYWMGMKRSRDRLFEPVITIDVHGGPPTILYQDNGPGIAPENREAVFRPFFSLKEKSRRRGLGLFIARECAERNGGTMILSDEGLAESGRLRQFVIELPPGSAT
jgi:signal transduction histidine kinase